MSSPIIAWLINAVPNKVQDLINNHKIRLESFVFFCRRTTLTSLTLENVILVTRQRKCSMLIFWHTRTNLNKRTAPRLLPRYCLPMMKVWAISNFQLWPRNSYSLRFLRTFTLKVCPMLFGFCSGHVICEWHYRSSRKRLTTRSALAPCFGAQFFKLELLAWSTLAIGWLARCYDTKIPLSSPHCCRLERSLRHPFQITVSRCWLVSAELLWR